MLRKVFVGALVLFLLLALAFFLYAKSNKPIYNGALGMNALDEQVEVYFDDYGVPHIYAENEKDAHRALGYVHAQDRLWQMEVVRRIAAGRLSELFGPDLVETDKFFKGLGIEYASARSMEMIDTSSPDLISRATCCMETYRLSVVSYILRLAYFLILCITPPGCVDAI
jgi:penicillin amidase